MQIPEFFAAPTVEKMAEWLESVALRESKAGTMPLVAGSTAGEMPLSFAQERMWFLAQLQQDSAPYLRPAAFRLRGPLDVPALERSLNRILERHEALRTTFQGRKGVPIQVVSPAQPLRLKILDLAALDGAARMERVRQMAADQVHQPFDLSRDLMLRASLVRLTPEDHCLLVTMHHIASDGWSTRVFLRELAALYQSFVTGAPAELPELRIQYGDYARWQRSWIEGEILGELLGYWKRRLEGLPPLLQLATNRPRTARETYRGARASLALPPELAGGLESLSRREQSTLFMTLLAAFQVLLHRYTASEDVAVGCPIANRTRVETEPLIGLFINTLVLRTDLSGEPGFRELLARVREAALGAYAHQEMPFEKLVETLDPVRSLSYSPLFQVMFQLRNLPFEPVSVPGIEIEPVDFDPGVAQFDLRLDISADGDGLGCALDYNADLFDQATARRMLGHYRTLLEGVVKDPDARISVLPLLSEAERKQVLVEWNDTARDFPSSALIHELFEAQAERTPDRVAVIFGGEQLSYRELNGRANQLARRLRSLGVGRDTPVGVCVERSPRAVVALLAILKAGGAFLPLDPQYPKERLACILEDAHVPVVVSERESSAKLPERLPHVVSLDGGWDEIARGGSDNLPAQSQPDSLAYVIYTSGSTGKPKGVLGLHQGLVNRLQWMWDKYPYEAGEVCCQKMALGFVDSIAEIFGPLLQGVPLVILPDDAVKGSPLELIRQLERSRVTRIVLAPSLLSSILEGLVASPTGLPRLKYWISSGEALPAETAARFGRLVPHGILINLYGSSEVSADVTCCQVSTNPAPNPVPLGRPIANTQIYILDSRLQPVPVGVPGEIYVGGAGLARGYLNRPELTVGRFVSNPFGPPGSRLFKTGDVGRYLPDGNIKFLGRRDDQVKVRGCRVELAEIEATLRRHPAVRAVAAVARGGERGETRLVAYLVCDRGEGVTAADLRSFVKQRLPEYMVPSHFEIVAALPLLASGKVDREALPDPHYSSAPTQAVFAGPHDAHESRLVRIWEELLEARPIGVHDDFFDLGGHSLLAARMAGAIEEAFGVTVPVATLFEAPTIAQLGALIRGDLEPAYPPRIVPIRPSGSRPRFFCVGGGPLMRPLAQRLGPDQPVFGLTLAEAEAKELAPPYTVPAIAGALVKSLREYQPEGPYYLGGYSLQGLFAYEVAQQLRAQGQHVSLLVLFDTFLPRRQYSIGFRAKVHLRSLRREIRGLRLREISRHVLGVAGMLWAELHDDARRSAVPWKRPPTLWEILHSAAAAYRPEPYAGAMVFFEGVSQPLGREAGTRFGWAELANGAFEVRTVPGDHLTLLDEPNVAVLAPELASCLRANGA
jgi:aspartate racemase